MDLSRNHVSNLANTKMRIFLEKGAEKWLNWAKSKFAQLSALRERLGLPKMTKAYMPAPGTLVWIMSSKFGLDHSRPAFEAYDAPRRVPGAS